MAVFNCTFFRIKTLTVVVRSMAKIAKGRQLHQWMPRFPGGEIE